MTNNTNLEQFIETTKKVFAPFKVGVKRRANGALLFDYVTPSGFYKEQWDWDGFFICMALSSEIPSEAIYLKNWVLNFLHNAHADGYTPGCITPKGPETGHRAILLKPFLAQGAYFASKFLKDFSWLKDSFDKLETVALYRQKLWNTKYDLGVWHNSMESGADNNIAVLNFPNDTVIGSDLNVFIYREYTALSLIAGRLGKTADAKRLKKRAATIKANINKFLWDEEDHAYYNLDSRNGSFIRNIGYNCFHPLWARMATQKQADSFIKQYMLKPNKLWSPFGIRTLAKDDPGYNNENIITPYSNWQGPVWPLTNYIAAHALFNYGYKKEAIETSKKIAQTCLDDIKKTGGMHENYNADNGKPLAAPNFISWNLLLPNIFQEIIEGKNPFDLP